MWVNIKSTPISRKVSCCSASGRLSASGAFCHDLRGDVGDVAARVAVFRGGLALGGGDQRVGEPVDLGAVVVEVVLAHHVGALRGEQPAQRVADGGPAGAADVDRPGRVGRDELQVDLVAGQRVGVAVGVAGVDDVVDDQALRRGLQPQVDEARSGDLRRGDAVGLRSAPRRAIRPVRAGWRRPSCRAAVPGCWRNRRARGCGAARR